MDYSLRSLRDAFEDADFKQSRSGYELYAVLLATSLDRTFILEYLAMFHELHVLTGSKVLVMGPQMGAFTRPGGLSQFDLHSVAGVISHNVGDRASSDPHSLDLAETFLKFMQDQTRESYALARYLGLPLTSIPSMVFFDSLNTPHDLVLWPLEGKSGRGFVRELRSLLQTVARECGWGFSQEYDRLKEQAEGYKKRYITASDVPYDLRAEWDAAQRAAVELKKLKDLIHYYQHIQALRVAYDNTVADPNVRIPLENVGITLSNLKSGQIRDELFSHLKKHYRRWKGWLPSEYKSLLAQTIYPDAIKNYIKRGN